MTANDKIYFETYEDAYTEACEQIDRLRAYCASAAQALEYVKLAGAYRFKYDALIDELWRASEHPTKNIELYAKDEEIAQLKAEISELKDKPIARLKVKP